MPITRRGLQIALGLLWFLDGILQFQPFMLGTGFAKQIVAPASDGQPELVAGPIHWAAGVIAAHPAAWDVPFATIQILIGLGLLVPRTVRLALAASVMWAPGVWFFGEGLSGLVGGHASLLTGAPGAALLYAVLSAAAWPRRGGSGASPAGWLAGVWAALWVGGAVFQALPGQNTGAAIASDLNAPFSVKRSVAPWIVHHGFAVVTAFVVVEALIGLGILSRRTRVAALGAGAVLATVIWFFAQDLGQLASGRATDPNTAPLIVLLAIALVPQCLATSRRAGMRTLAQPAEAFAD